MKLHCFSNLHPLILTMYYFFLLVFTFHFNNLIFAMAIFFSIVILNYFCGCIGQTFKFIRYFFVLGIMLCISNFILMLPINIFTVSNFISFCSAAILFLSFNKIVDSGKFLYLCSKISPHLALILNICMRYIFLLQKRINDFICIHSLNSNKKIDNAVALVTKIFDWCINDCIEMITVLKSKNYTGNFTCYKIYRLNGRDVFFMCKMLFLCSVIFLCSKYFFAVSISLFLYLILPFMYDFFCYVRFFIREGRKYD